MKKKYFKVNLVLALLFFTTGMFAQKQISGNVTSSDSQPLPGVSIVVKGTATGVSTDFDGNYAISNVANNATLVFSYLGFTTKEMLIGSQSTINVVLEEDVSTLDEVVVVGYGTKKRSEVVGSIATVSGEELQKNPSPDFASSLAGRLPGLTINQTSTRPGEENTNIIIRGHGTYRNNSVLIVIDGIPSRDGLTRLDANDIESTTVLKGAAASIYGSRAANGVILITTKRGYRGPAEVTFQTNVSINAPTRFTKVANAFDYGRQVNAVQTRQGLAATYSASELEDLRSFQSTDWMKGLFESSTTSFKHDISMRGGGETNKYFISIGKRGQPNSAFSGDNVSKADQYNFRANIDVDATDNLVVSLDLSGRLYESVIGGSTFDALIGATRSSPLEPIFRDGKLFSRAQGALNPLALFQKEGGYSKAKQTLFNGTLKLKYKIPGVNGLSVSLRGAVDFTQNYNKSFADLVTQYVPDPNDLSQLIEDRVGKTANPTLSEAYSRNRRLLSYAEIAYKRKFNDVHSVDAFVGIEETRVVANGTTVSRHSGLLSLQNDQLSSGDVETQLNGSSASEQAIQSYVGRLDYVYDEKYSAQFQFRHDGSYILNPDNNSEFLPSVGASWTISKENFLKDNSTISFLKLRSIWGKIGNDNIDPFQFLNRFSPNGSQPLQGGNVPVITTVGADANPFVTWEVEEALDIGLDSKFFNDKLLLNLTYFETRRENILSPRNATVPKFTGITLPDENIGITENKGFEIELGYKTTFGEVGFNALGNVSYSKSNLVFNDAVPPLEGEEYQDLNGHKIFSRLLYDAIGIYRTQEDLDNNPGLPGVGLGDLIYADTNDDGTITTNDRIVFDEGQTPEFTFGLALGATYKGFELSTFIQGQTNASIQEAVIYSGAPNSANAPAYYLENAYTVDTPNATLPRIGNSQTQINGYDGSNASTFWQRDASFIRLKTVELSYSLPKEILNTIGVNSLRIYANGNNLLTFDKFKKDGLYDPENVSGLGISFPNQKIYNFGLSVTF